MPDALTAARELRHGCHGENRDAWVRTLGGGSCEPLKPCYGCCDLAALLTRREVEAVAAATAEIQRAAKIEALESLLPVLRIAKRNAKHNRMNESECWTTCPACWIETDLAKAEAEIINLKAGKP